ncbi:MAG: alpha-E domain-containing protein, partial [Acidobacteriaceae bacterium]|nr:alpha-E domain-containing protein [Acidobacteriaceae bacterium]
FLERAFATAKLLDVHFREFFVATDEPGDPSDQVEWIGLLRSCTAFEAYCKVYTADLKPERAAEFLLLNSEFPHAIRFAVDRIQQSLECIHDITGSKRSGSVAKLAGRLRSELSFTPLDEIREDLHGFLGKIRKQCTQIHTALHQVYITYSIEAALEV